MAIGKYQAFSNDGEIHAIDTESGNLYVLGDETKIKGITELTMREWQLISGSSILSHPKCAEPLPVRVRILE